MRTATIPIRQTPRTPPRGGSENTDAGVGADYVPTGEKETGTSGLEDGSTARLKQYGNPQYYWGETGEGNEPLVKTTHAVSSRVVDVEVTFSPRFVDCTYGTGAQGWSPNRGHTFADLYKSDHVELSITNGNGETVFAGKLDLISPTSKVSSGYAALGPFGGDGSHDAGNPDHVLSFGTSLDDNINYYGYNLFENSPKTDETFSPNPAYPNWEFYVTYRLTLDIGAFGKSGYGKVLMTSVHASPAKTPNETIQVTEGVKPDPNDDPFRFKTTKTTEGDDHTTSDTTHIPSDTTVTPSDSTTIPSDTTTTPSDTTTIPSDTSTVPADTSWIPSDTSAAPADTSL